MIVLPAFPPRRACLRSFGLVVSFVVWCLLGILSALAKSPLGVASGSVIVIVLVSLSILRPSWISIPYRLWNRLAYEFTRFARWWLIGVCFYVIFTIVGRSKSALWLARPNTSVWESRENQPYLAKCSRPGVTTEEFSEQSRFTSFLAWAKRPDNWWTLCLLPFLVLLSALEIEQEQRDFPSNVYTLF